MKVFFFTREDFHLSGARIRCYGLAEELRKYGIESEVFSFARQLGAPCGEKELEMGLVRKIKYNIQAFRYLRKRVSADSVIFMQRLNYHTLAPLLISRLGRIKFIFDCDDWNIRENPVYHFGFYPSSKMEYLTRRLARRSSACIAASGFLQEYLSRFNPKTYYLPTGVDTCRFKPSPENKASVKITFSWIGTAYHPQMGENLNFILDIFADLAEKHNNIYLSLAGEGKYFDEVIGGLSNFKHKARVINEGWIPPEQIPDYLSKIDIGLLPLIQNTKFNLAKSPTKLFEYMAMAKPTVSSRIGEAEKVIHDGVNGFLAKDKEEFGLKLGKLITDSALRMQMGTQACRSTQEQYSLDILGKQLYEIIRTV